MIDTPPKYRFRFETTGKAYIYGYRAYNRHKQ